MDHSISAGVRCPFVAGRTLALVRCRKNTGDVNDLGLTSSFYVVCYRSATNGLARIKGVPYPCESSSTQPLSAPYRARCSAGRVARCMRCLGTHAATRTMMSTSAYIQQSALKCIGTCEESSRIRTADERHTFLKAGMTLPMTSPKPILYGTFDEPQIPVMRTVSPSWRKHRCVPSFMVTGFVPFQEISSMDPNEPGSDPLMVPDPIKSPGRTLHPVDVW